MLTRRFYILCDQDGNQEPFMSLGPEKKYENLANLARGHMSKSDGVKIELESINDVFDGVKKMHSFGGDDWCIIDFRKEKSTATNGFDEFEPFEIDSKDVFKLLKDWHKFLLKYENGKIPGIKPPSGRNI